MTDDFIGPIFGPDARPEDIEHARRVREEREAVYKKVDTIIARLAQLHARCPRHSCRRHRACQHIAAPDARYHGSRPPCRLGGKERIANRE